MSNDRLLTMIISRRFRYFLNQIWVWFAILLIVPLLVACATSTRTADHSFEFDMRGKDASVDIMDYRYGSSDLTGTRRPEWAKKAGGPSGSSHIYGTIPVADELFVEWRIKATGELMRKSVDLRQLLPRDLNGYTVTFIVNERLLQIFLISPERRPKEFPVVGPPKYNERKAYQIFPLNNLPEWLK